MNHNKLVKHITGQSKDGFEKDISRIESKRNFFYFIRKNYVGNQSDIHNDENVYWISKIKSREKKLQKQQEMFLAGQFQDNDDNFAYEGIFDKKETDNRLTNKVDKSRMDISRIASGAFNNSNNNESMLIKTSNSQKTSINK